MDRDEAIRIATAEAGPDGRYFGWRLRGARLVEVPEKGQTMAPPYWAVEFTETHILPGGGEEPTHHGGLLVEIACATGQTQSWNYL